MFGFWFPSGFGQVLHFYFFIWFVLIERVLWGKKLSIVYIDAHIQLVRSSIQVFLSLKKSRNKKGRDRRKGWDGKGEEMDKGRGQKKGEDGEKVRD